jgi:CheY-like chemotaxis protein
MNLEDMIKSILLVDDEDLFHLVFEDACSYLDIALDLQAIDSADRADQLFADWHQDPTGRPECVFVDLNIIGSTFDGIELVRRVNQEHGNGCVIGIISSSSDRNEIERAKACGAQFWLVKSDDIEPRLELFRQDYSGFKEKSASFKIYE